MSTHTRKVVHGPFAQRVINNFQISGQVIPTLLIHTYLRVKRVYANVNHQTSKLDPQRTKAIDNACKSLLKLPAAELRQLFPLDYIQSGGGTSTNMVVNEVVAYFAQQELGSSRPGTFSNIHPNDHVNMSQSSNDTYPGVTKIMAALQLTNLLAQLDKLQGTLHNKSRSFRNIRKVGRTHLQDAVPLALGEEFSAFARIIAKNNSYLRQTQKLLYELPFGATALGTLQNITPQIRKLVIRALAKEFNLPFIPAKNYFEATSSSSDLAKVAAALASLANDLIKISSDLRLLASGPRAGLAEITLPAVQAGSSIMPGKINPSILEALEMTCFRVSGNNHTVQIATRCSQLQLQAFMPIIAYALYEIFELLTNGIIMFNEKCLQGLTANKASIAQNLERSFVYATEYAERLGYDKVAQLVQKAYKDNLNLRELLEQELLSN